MFGKRQQKIESLPTKAEEMLAAAALFGQLQIELTRIAGERSQIENDAVNINFRRNANDRERMGVTLKVIELMGRATEILQEPE